MAYLLFHLLIGLTILTNTRSQAENDFGSCSSDIELTIEQREQRDVKPTYNVYCKSRTKPFDDSAEFQVDGYSREHILIIKNRCFDRKKQECSFDYCGCDPDVNGFTVKFKMDNLTVGQTIGCQVRIRNAATGIFLKILTSNLFNGTDFVPHECNVKVIGTTKGITNTTSNSSSPSGGVENNADCNLSIYLLISVVTVETLILILVMAKWSPQCLGSETEVRLKTFEDETLLSTQDHTQNLKEKIKELGTELKIIKPEVESKDTPVMSSGIDVNDYFTIRCDSVIIYCGNFYEVAEQGFKRKQGERLQHEKGQELQHEQGQELQPEQIFRNERILDMCFTEHKNELCLVYIDADNNKIVRQNIIPGKDRKEFSLKKQPNRLSKINDETVAVIYKKGLEVLIFNVKEMKEENTCKIPERHILESRNGIQGILALSANNFILTDKMHLCVLEMNGNAPIVKKLDFESKLEFDTARRLTHAITSDDKKDFIFIADENDKKITSITIPPQNEGKENIDGHLIGQQMDHNRGLQNVRAIVATQSRIYAATSSGISVFCHTKGRFKNWGSESSSGQNSESYKMLVEYKKHVEHTRGLCLYNFDEYIHIGLSCVINHKDVMLVFKLNPNHVFE